VTRLDVVEVVVEYSNTARAATRTVVVEDRKYIDRAADEAEVLFYTATDTHAAVAGVLDDNNLVDVALDPEVLGLTQRVLHQQRRSVYTVPRTDRLLGWSSCTRNEDEEKALNSFNNNSCLLCMTLDSTHDKRQ